MSRTLLHLVDRLGQNLPVVTQAAVEAAYRWAIREFNHLDPALVAGWAEEIGKVMAERGTVIEMPRRYAFAALHGKIREWFRDEGLREISAGIGIELEQWVGVDRSSQGVMERAILFEQLRTKLSERDRHILILLQQDMTSPARVSAALGVSYSAAAKAIQRVKERITALLVGASLADETGTSPTFCKSES
jgi:hypothetical protein